MNERVLVGYDGSVCGAAAVDWAAAEAARRGASLTVLAVENELVLPAVPPVMPAVVEAMEAASAQIAEEGAERARKVARELDVTALGRIATSVPGALVEASREAGLLVVGTRGHGEIIGMLLGSVAFAVTAHAACPVVVVRGDADAGPGPQHPVVVGVDGSAAAWAAVRWGADEAATASAPLVLVAAFPGEAGTVAREQALDAVGEAARLVARRHADLEVRTRVEDAAPVPALLAAAEGAGLLTVGARAEGGFAGLRIGSVTHAAVHAAPCPVAVIHAAG